jgi:hypothetical protein
MKQRRTSRGLSLVAAALALTAGLISLPTAVAAADIDPEADRVLRAMSTHLESLKTFSFSSEIDNELINLEGQKLQLSGSGKALFQRPSRFYMSRQGMFSDVDMSYDGETVTLLGKRQNAYMQLPVSGTTDDAMRTLEQVIGLDFPGADLLLSDLFSILSDGIESSSYIGVVDIGGVESHHLAFREDKFDWQLWVSTGDEPLPMKYVITSKWMTGAPQFSLRLSDWNQDPVIEADSFDFSPPAGARRLETLEVNEMGELTMPEEQ